ncbi:DUF3094 domain-containing protein [Endozoicomonas sp. ONNA2]|uniref:DUF3094 domain-containing protein n=1 Tax=Endozoicomonas sp. ONNA2 TaxID=2828741 RepID=UPI0021491398|nr:DUF3094 domain-containing protein [Endozoicomonas sp. ONNA2]
MSHNTSVADNQHIANCDHQSRRLYPEDQQRVDQYLEEGVNEVERSPFRPLRLMVWLTVVIVVLGVLSRVIGYLVLPS